MEDFQLEEIDLVRGEGWVISGTDNSVHIFTNSNRNL